MLERTGDIWEYHELGHWIVITTNGIVTKGLTAVMGRGIAKDAAQRFPGLPVLLGSRLKTQGNHVFRFYEPLILTFPVKHHWRELASLTLIKRSAEELVVEWDKIVAEGMNADEHSTCCLVRPGCGNGGLRWESVKNAIAPILDDRFVVVDRS